MQAYVTGAPAIQNDLDPVFSKDLQKGESIALPIALVVLLLVFGLSWAVTIPLLFAASTVFGTLSIVYVIAHFMTTPTYVTNLVFLIGLGIAIDYSLLIVYRFREELAHGLEVDAAVLRTMQTAGRAVMVSGATVAIGLALLMFMPLPFIRAIGIEGSCFRSSRSSRLRRCSRRCCPSTAAAARAACRSPRSCATGSTFRCGRPRSRTTSSIVSGRGPRGRSCAGSGGT